MKKLILCLCIAALTSGCATTQRMDIRDLCTMKPDCANKAAQLRFLESQRSTVDERLWSALTIGGVSSRIMSELDGSYATHHAIVNRKYDTCVSVIVWELKTYCPD